MPLEIIRNDITRVSADVIVNSANPKPKIGYGVDSRIYKAAGKKELLEQRRKIGNIAPGDCAITDAFDLDAKYIIHTVGPVWHGGRKNEEETVKKCYRNCLESARKLGAESIAFPLISTGNYGFPKDRALSIAIDEIGKFLFESDMTVYLVVYDRKSFKISEKLFKDIKSYIEEREVSYFPPPFLVGSAPLLNRSMARSDYEAEYYDEAMLLEPEADQATRHEIPSFKPKKTIEEEIPKYLIDEEEDFPEVPSALEEALADETDIDAIIKNRADTFQEMLFRIIDRKELTDPYVYKKANIDRKLFSKIRSDVNYNPSKKTAVALAIALELNLDETKDLLLRAGIALSPSSVFDLIIEYCIENRITDIHEINCILFDYDQPTLGV